MGLAGGPDTCYPGAKRKRRCSFARVPSTGGKSQRCGSRCRPYCSFRCSHCWSVRIRTKTVDSYTTIGLLQIPELTMGLAGGPDTCYPGAKRKRRCSFARVPSTGRKSQRCGRRCCPYCSFRCSRCWSVRIRTKTVDSYTTIGLLQIPELTMGLAGGPDTCYPGAKRKRRCSFARVPSTGRKSQRCGSRCCPYCSFRCSHCWSVRIRTKTVGSYTTIGLLQIPELTMGRVARILVIRARRARGYDKDPCWERSRVRLTQVTGFALSRHRTPIPTACRFHSDSHSKKLNPSPRSPGSYCCPVPRRRLPNTVQNLPGSCSG